MTPRPFLPAVFVRRLTRWAAMARVRELEDALRRCFTIADLPEDEWDEDDALKAEAELRALLGSGEEQEPGA